MSTLSSRYYRLEGHEPVRVADLAQWAQHCDYTVRRVGWTYVGDAKVSTMFIGIDWCESEADPPQIYETLVIGGELDKMKLTAATWEEAEAVHRTVCERLALAVAVEHPAAQIAGEGADDGAAEPDQRFAAGVGQRAAGPRTSPDADDHG